VYTITGSALSPTPEAVDIHAHFVPERVPDLGARLGGSDWPWIRRDSDDRATIMIGPQEFRPITSQTWDVAQRIADMDLDQIETQIVSPTPLFFSYDRPLGAAIEAVALYNDLIIEHCQSSPRLHALCQVPMQDLDAACAELERSVRAGCVGVEIGNHLGDTEADSDAYVEFLQHCAHLGVPVLMHPWEMLGGGRLDRFMMAWTVGMPAETHLSMVAMILGGAFERLPESLRLCFAHGGGSFAFLLGRLDNAWRRRDISRGRATMAPSEYVHRFFVDSAVFDPRALRLLVEVMGDDRVMLGSDYPYPLGEERVGDLVRTAGLADSTTTRLLGANAHTFFSLNDLNDLDAPGKHP
jgi:aminocarboxymuconate-semialdehyde decarboxylase